MQPTNVSPISPNAVKNLRLPPRIAVNAPSQNSFDEDKDKLDHLNKENNNSAFKPVKRVPKIKK